jgi:sugar lactone lactonase YvrE
MKYANQIRILRMPILAVVIAACLAVAPLAYAGNKKAAPKEDLSKLVWPSPPDEARIKFIGQYNGELELMGMKAPKPRMLERLAGVSVSEEERPRLWKPYGVAADSKGRVYVADTPQHVVFVFDLEQKKVAFRGEKAPANLVNPIGVAVDDQDRLFVTDSKLHQVTCFGPNGNFVAAFGEKDLQRPAGAAVDSALRRLYVVDVAQRRIAVFNLDTLKLERYFAELKSPDDDRTGALTNPNSIAIDPDGLLYITDAIVPRVFVYDTDGNFVRVWGNRGDGPGMFGRPKGIAIDRDGHVYVGDAQLNRLQVFAPEGKPLLQVGGAGWGAAQFMLMAGVAIDSSNRIIVVDQVPPRIEVFRYITDAEAAEAKKNPQSPAKSAPTEASAKPAPDVAKKPAAPSGPTVEELQKELADLKAKMAAQQKKDTEGGATPDGTSQPGTPATDPDKKQ